MFPQAELLIIMPGRVRGPVRSWAIWTQIPEERHRVWTSRIPVTFNHFKHGISQQHSNQLQLNQKHLSLGDSGVRESNFPHCLLWMKRRPAGLLHPPPCLQEGWNMQFKSAAEPLLSRSQNPESHKWNFPISEQFAFASKTATMKPHDSLLGMFHVTSPWSGFRSGYVRLPFFALVTEI